MFWTVLQHAHWFEEFLRYVQAVPFSEQEWKDSGLNSSSPPVAAGRFFVRCRQSLAGRMQGFTGITRTRTRGGMNAEVSAWLGAIKGLPAVHARLKRVLVLNRPALDVIAGQDGPRTLFYLDPPYLHSTRATTGEYRHEMTEADHAALLDTLQSIKGRFLLSGYRSHIYDRAAERSGWRRTDFLIDNKAAGGGTKRQMTECVWANYPTPPLR